MVIFHSYVSLPKGIINNINQLILGPGTTTDAPQSPSCETQTHLAKGIKRLLTSVVSRYNMLTFLAKYIMLLKYSYGHLAVISTYNPIYRMYNPIYNQL